MIQSFADKDTEELLNLKATVVLLLFHESRYEN